MAYLFLQSERGEKGQTYVEARACIDLAGLQVIDHHWVLNLAHVRKWSGVRGRGGEPLGQLSPLHSADGII